MTALRLRRHYADDEPDDIAIVPLPSGLAVLIIFALGLLLWGAIAGVVTWALGSLPW